MMKWLLSDLHVHTKHSDGTMKIKEVIDFYGKLNFDVIAITDHILDSISELLPKWILPYNWIKNQHDFYKYFDEISKESLRAKKKYNMLVIPGIEFTNYISNIHVVGLDIKKYIKPTRKIIESLKEAKKQGMLLIGAHPADSFMKMGGGLWKNKDVSELIDVWEAGNGINFFPHVVYNGYKIIANTDFHGEGRDNGIKGWKTLINAEKNIESIKGSILDQKIALYKFRNDYLKESIIKRRFLNEYLKLK